MAAGATIYKAKVDISDIDRQYYDTKVITMALHPSETTERLSIRLMSYCLFAGVTQDRLEFGRGLSAEGEAALWEIDDTGSIARWIEVGTPDVKVVRKSAGRSNEVIIIAYGDVRVDPWWRQVGSEMQKIRKLSVATISDEEVSALEQLMSRTMHLAVTIQDGVMWLSDSVHTAQVQLKWLLRRD